MKTLIGYCSNIVFFIIACFNGGCVQACDWYSGELYDLEYAHEADAIFIGKIISYTTLTSTKTDTPNTPKIMLDLQVIEKIKGSTVNHFKISECFADFAADKNYVFFTKKDALTYYKLAAPETVETVKNIAHRKYKF